MPNLGRLGLAWGLVLIWAGAALAAGLGSALEGQRAQSRGDYQQAIRCYTVAVEVGDLGKETVSDILINRGAAHKHLGEYQKALDDYTAAIAKNPNNALAYNNRGAMHRQMGQIEKALADYAKALQITSTAGAQAATYNAPGSLKKDEYLSQSQWEDLQEAKRIAAMAYFNRGNIHLDQGALQLALADYDRALDRNPRMAKVYFNRALVRERLGRYLEAAKDMTTAAHLAPFRKSYAQAAERLAALARDQKAGLASQ